MGRPTLLFDLDGTLIDTWRLYLTAYGQALEPHVGRLLTAADLAAMRPASEIQVFRDLLPAADVPVAHAGFIQLYARLFTSHCDGFYPAVPAMLDQLRAMGLQLGLVTGKSRNAWQVTAAHLPLGRFDVVVTDDDMPRPKPSPDGLLMALERLGIAADDAVYIGDTMADVGAAKAAGIRYIGILWPKSASEKEAFAAEVRRQGAWNVVETPGDLADLFV